MVLTSGFMTAHRKNGVCEQRQQQQQQAQGTFRGSDGDGDGDGGSGAVQAPCRSISDGGTDWTPVAWSSHGNAAGELPANTWQQQQQQQQQQQPAGNAAVHVEPAATAALSPPALVVTGVRLNEVAGEVNSSPQDDKRSPDADTTAQSRSVLSSRQRWAVLAPALLVVFANVSIELGFAGAQSVFRHAQVEALAA
jgi:hypothetical protein